MTISTIDIGTNTVLMVTARIDRTGDIEVLGDEHAIARLGRGVDRQRRIGADAFDRVESVLERYVRIARGYGAERVVAFGTSALRDAANRDEFVAEMMRRSGLRIEVLSGEDEAAWSYRGALFGLTLHGGPVAVLDIGGGSTEIAMGDGRESARAVSVDIGAVRVSERHLHTLPPSPEHLAEARSAARAALAGAIELPAGVTVVGVAGTVTTLAAIARGIDQFDAAELNGMRLSHAEVAHSAEIFALLSEEATAAIPQVSPGRADVILGGTLVLQAFMEESGIAEIVVSTAGVRYGILRREVERGHKKTGAT